MRRTRHEAGAALLHDHVVAPGVPPASSQAWQVPSVGWPANGSSGAGREDAHAVVGVRVVGGSTNVVSERFVQFANRCISSVVEPVAVEHDGDRVAGVRRRR